MGRKKIGDQIKATPTELGIWAEMQIDISNEYWGQVRKLLKEEKLFLSSGSMGHLIKTDEQRNIREWPWVELSITPTPANPYAVVDAGNAFRSVGLYLPEERIAPPMPAPPEPEDLPQPQPDPIGGLWLQYMEAMNR